MKKLLSALLLGFASLASQAHQVDTITVFSPSMDKNISNVVILPDGYDRSEALPVVYMLHGYHSRPVLWTDVCPDLPPLADTYGLIVVCPDGANSWYFDSPLRPESRYETYVAKELVDYIDRNYRTLAAPSGRAITGFSMGGHGAMWLAIRHQDTFGACGASSGGVDFRPFPDSWEIKSLLGDYRTDAAVWDKHVVINQLHLIGPSLAIIFDCGTDDFFFAVNERLHREMLYRNIRHEYTVRPGSHNSAYWRCAFPHHLLFFHQYFRSHRAQ